MNLPRMYELHPSSQSGKTRKGMEPMKGLKEIGLARAEYES